MCGRYAHWDSDDIAKQYDCVANLALQSNHNVSPTSYIPVLVERYVLGVEAPREKPHTVVRDHIPPNTDTTTAPSIHAGMHKHTNGLVRSLELMKWGLVPDWAKPEQHKGFINVRSETVHTKKSFFESFVMRRCIIPAKGFYEWDEHKQPYYISNKSEHLALAGVWDGSNNAIHPTVAILTTDASALKSIHHRCPVVLSTRKEIDLWLTPTSQTESLLEILAHASDAELRANKIEKHTLRTR